MKKLHLCLLWLPVCLSLNATSIIPYNDLGELTSITDHIILAYVINESKIDADGKTFFQYDLEIEQIAKGNLNPTDNIKVRRYKQHQNGMERKVFGDIKLKPGRIYLLFLDHLYNDVFRPQVMNYYVFEEIIHQGKSYLKPNQESAHLQVVDHASVEALGIYKKDELINHLKSVSKGIESWSKKKVISNLNSLDISTRNEQPGHCNNYYDEDVTRWKLFDEGSSLPVYIDANLDFQKNHSNTLVERAINYLEEGFNNTSVNLEFAGAQDFNPCTSGAWYDNSANGYFFQQWADTTIGHESIHIMFNDPCGELPKFKCGRKGTIAFGGLYRTLDKQHEYAGSKWFNGYLGFVLVADGAGCISDSRYTSVLMHEITHALSLGHIQGAGTALMNSGCCMPITDLDHACMSFMYYKNETKLGEQNPDEASTDSSSVFVELAGHSEGKFNHLKFATKKHRNWGKFVIERSIDGYTFTSIAVINKSSESETLNKYDLLDEKPKLGANYYRISQVLNDGIKIYSNIIQLQNESTGSIQASPNPVSGAKIEISIEGHAGHNGQLTIFDITGKKLSTDYLRLKSGRTKIEKNTSELKSGAYYLVWKNDDQFLTQKIIKT